MVLHRMTRQYDAVTSVCVKSAQQDDEGGTSANDEGIGEDSQTLQQALIDGMRYGGCGSGIGGATFTCFVRVRASHLASRLFLRLLLQPVPIRKHYGR